MEISRRSVPDSMSVSSNPFRQDQGAHHQERVIEDGAPKHGGKDGYRGIGQEIGIIKAEHQLRYAASAGRRTQNGNHPHHPLPAPRHQHVSLTMEGYENGYDDGESRQPSQGSITHQLQPEPSALLFCLLRSHRHLFGKHFYLRQKLMEKRNLAASLQYPSQDLGTMQQQEVEDGCPDSHNKGADDEDNLHSTLNPFVRCIRRNSHSICQTEKADAMEHRNITGSS